MEMPAFARADKKAPDCAFLDLEQMLQKEDKICGQILSAVEL